MLEDQEFEHIKKEAGKISISPSDSAWDKLESKLDQHKEKRIKKITNHLRFIVSLAAVFTILIISVSIIYQESNQLREVQKGKIAEWESLDIEKEYFYSIDQIKGLYAAYSE